MKMRGTASMDILVYKPCNQFSPDIFLEMVFVKRNTHLSVLIPAWLFLPLRLV